VSMMTLTMVVVYGVANLSVDTWWAIMRCFESQIL
jgi:hypothetical protein